MKLLKIVFSILILLILVCVIAVACLILFLDPNKLKPVLVEEVKQETGYGLAIEGKLSWSFYPRVGIKAERIALNKPNQTTPFIDLHDVRVATELSQLFYGKEKLQGNIFISDVRLANLRAQNVSADLKLENKFLTLDSIKASLYEGSLQGVAHGRDLSGTPHWDWNVQFSNIQLKPLLQDLNGAESKLKVSGVGQIKMIASTQGKGRDQMLSNLNGTSEFNLNNGVVEGVDLNYLVQSADALINKQAMPAAADTNQTAFTSLAGSVIIKNGIADTNNLLLNSAAFTAKGEGNITLISQAINFQLQVKPLLNTKIQLEIPVLMTGNLIHPEVRLDTRELEKFIAKQEIEKLKTKASEQIQKHIPGKAGEFLQKFLGK